MVEVKAGKLPVEVERPSNHKGLRRSGAMEDFGRTERKHQLRPVQRESSFSSSDGAILGAPSMDMVQVASATTAVKKFKESERELSDRNFVDLTADSPHTDGTRLAISADNGSPELSFLRRHHRTSHRPRAAFVPDRSQVPGEAEILVMDAEAGQTTKPKKLYSGSRTSRETRDKLPFNFIRADGQRGSADMLEDAATSSGASSASGGRRNLRPAVSLDANEKKQKAAVPLDVRFEVGGCSSDPERRLVWKRKRSSTTDSGTGRHRFKPPRQVRDCNRSGSSYGGMERPIEIDSLEPPSSSAVAENNVMSSPNRARQIEEDELLAKFLQEDYGLEADGGSLILDDAQLAQILQEEENARYMQQRVESAPHAELNVSTLRAAAREMQRVLPTVRSQATRPAASSSRMRILRNLHDRSRQHMTRGHRVGGPALNSDEQLLHFPEGLDLEARVELLAAMETVSQGSFTMLNRVNRDFNEGDYEMLLALDDRNHSQSGASHSKIEQLPIAVIKPTDVYQETCSICLEIPVVDDVVRRLPCMHGFHLQCIDEWLGRQANCPICKMAI